MVDFNKMKATVLISADMVKISRGLITWKPEMVQAGSLMGVLRRNVSLESCHMQKFENEGKCL